MDDRAASVSKFPKGKRKKTLMTSKTSIKIASLKAFLNLNIDISFFEICQRLNEDVISFDQP